MRFKGDKAREERDLMNTNKANITTTEQPYLVKRIGKTTYHVNVHFNPNAKETMSDKIIRMLRDEVRQSPKI